MSYCRFSSDDFQCDVYTYADVYGGYTTYVASYKYIFKKPLPPEVDISDSKAWCKRSVKVGKIVDKAKSVPIGLKYDGACFNDDTAAECADTLEMLREEGYRVPQYAIDALREEAMEEEDGKDS